MRNSEQVAYQDMLRNCEQSLFCDDYDDAAESRLSDEEEAEAKAEAEYRDYVASVHHAAMM
jgi:hypothetical protein